RNAQLQFGVDASLYIRGKVSNAERAGGLSGREQVRRTDNRPFTTILSRELAQRVTPAADAFLARVDLLAAAYQTHACAPLGVSCHESQQQLWLRRIPVELFASLLLVPGPLRFIKHDHVFVWRNVGRP